MHKILCTCSPVLSATYRRSRKNSLAERGRRNELTPGSDQESMHSLGAKVLVLQRYLQDSFFGSARESVKPRDSSGSAALAFIVLAATVAGGMWKPAFCAGFQALWESGESPTFDFSTISTTRHFHSEAGKQPNQALCAHRHAGGTVRG